MNGGLDVAYPLVDRLEADQPTEDDVQPFAKEGLLGQGAVEEQAKWSRLRLTDASGDAGGTLTVWQASEAYIAQPTPQSDLEFVRTTRFWLGGVNIH